MGGSTEDHSARRSPAPRKPLSGLHDVELAKLAMGADRAAFGELARRHGSGLRQYLKRLGAAQTAVDALALEVFSEAFDRIADFRGEGLFAIWLRRLAAQLFVRRWRKLIGTEPLTGVVEGGEAAALAPWTQKDRLDLDVGLQRLTPGERLNLGLIYGAHLSAVEAAELTGDSPSDFRLGLRRALVEIRLSPDQSPPPFAPDPAFEAYLVRQYDEAGAAPDAAAFAEAVADRLHRGWTLRRWLIGALGVAGGVIALAQVAGSNVLERGAAISHASVTVAARSVSTAPALASLTARLVGLVGAPFALEAFWAVVALLVLSGGFLIARLIEEI